MINHIHVRLRGLAQGPVGPLRAIAGVAVAAAGLFLLRRFVDDQLEQLAVLGKQAYQLQADLARAGGRVDALEDQAAGAAYPAPEDLDPVDRAGDAEPRFMADQR
jgi:hypothetical protein